MSKNKDPKYRDLFMGLLFDGIGMLSMAIPFIGDFSDVIWAPMSAWIMIRMYKGTAGKVAGTISFIEEILPGFDIIPTFTLMWLYTYVFSKAVAKKNIGV